MAKGFRVTIKTINSEVTGSGTLIKIKRPGQPYERLLVDFGGIQEEAYKHLNYSIDFEPSELSYVLVTHSHLDHIMRLPMLTKYGFHREIYCTPTCKKSIPISLKDSLKIMQSDYDRYGKEMLYHEKELEEIEDLLKSIEYNLPTHVSKGVKVTFLSNGHLYGSASILLQISCPKYEDKNILITGDYYPTNELFKVKDIPEWVLKLENLTIIQESTYGSTSVDDVNKNLNEHILNALSKNKNILFPVISQERLELVLYRLKLLQDSKLLSKDIKIYVHTELGKEYLEKVYLDSKEIIDFMPKNVVLIPKGDFETAISDKNQKIILSSSGMAENGCVRFYLKEILPKEDYTVIFTCFTPKETLGYKLRNSIKGSFVKIDDVTVPLCCDVKHSGELSKHVKYEDIIKYINQFRSVKNVLLTHGETKTKTILHSNLQKVFPNINFYITNRETGFKLDPNCDITTYATEFVTESDFQYNAKEVTKSTKKKKCKKCKKETVKKQGCHRCN